MTVEQVSQSKKILAELSTKTTLKDFNETLLFHYPIEEWNGFYVGSYHLHGHIHNTTVTHIDRRYNVSVDVINYTPVTLDELIAQNDVK